jgi:hypothetical protein
MSNVFCNFGITIENIGFKFTFYLFVFKFNKMYHILSGIVTLKMSRCFHLTYVHFSFSHQTMTQIMPQKSTKDTNRQHSINTNYVIAEQTLK